MEINEMQMPEIEQRMQEINALITSGEECDIDALTSEFDKLEARAKEIKTEAEKRGALAARVATGSIGETVERKEVRKMNEEKIYTVGSPEYRTAWLKEMAVRNGEHLLGEMNTEERAAFTFLTTNTTQVVPEITMNRIVELVESKAPMYADAKKSGLSQGFAIPRHVSIDAGDAAQTEEGKANVDEQDTFDLLALDGVEIKKHLVISRKMKFKSIDAFEAWIVDHISDRIAVAKENLILQRLDAVATGIAAANKLTAQTYTDAAIRGAFALLKGTGAKRVYANSKTIWTGLAGITDGDGRKAFIPASTDDPLVVGRVYGAAIVEDNNLADNVAYIGIPDYLLANEYDALTLNRSMDPKTFEDIIAGYSLFDAGLEDPKAYAKVSFTA